MLLAPFNCNYVPIPMCLDIRIPLEWSEFDQIKGKMGEFNRVLIFAS